MLTDQQHPITPPPELRRLWARQAQRMDPWDSVAWLEHVSTQAARWGADQVLRDVRRPKPPSLAEQALDVLNLMLMFLPPGDQREQGETIRRALERLQELESNG